MLALTLWPEWAWAICHLDKRVENRGWKPPSWLIGQRIGIHAGKHIGGRASFRAQEDGLARGPHMRTSALVATAILVGADRDTLTAWDVPDAWHWRLADVVVLDPSIPMRGKQGLWPVAVSLEEVLR